MYLKDDELTIIYNGNQYKSKQMIGLARTISNKINMQDITTTRVSMNLFCVLLSKIDTSPKQMVNRADIYYQTELRNQNFSNENWFYILKNNPELLINPLVYYKKIGRICLTPTDILKVA